MPEEEVVAAMMPFDYRNLSVAAAMKGQAVVLEEVSATTMKGKQFY